LSLQNEVDEEHEIFSRSDSRASRVSAVGNMFEWVRVTSSLSPCNTSDYLMFRHMPWHTYSKLLVMCNVGFLALSPNTGFRDRNIRLWKFC